MNPDRAARLTGAADRASSERLTLFPMVAGRYTAATADPDRHELTVSGVVLESFSAMRLNDNVVGRDFNTQVAVAPIGVFISIDDLASAIFKRADRIQRLDRPGQPLLEIVRADANGAGRIVFRCVRIACP